MNSSIAERPVTGDIQKVALLAVTSDVRRSIHHNEATVTMPKIVKMP